MKRRNVLKSLTILPLAGGVVGGIFPMESVLANPGAEKFKFFKGSGSEAMAVDGPLTPGPQIYQSIGVEPFINCRGTFSIIGGSLERPETRTAMDSAAKHFVQYDELAEGVGRRLAAITGAEWGVVSSGCSGVLKLVTIACVTGGNPEKLHRIPDLTGFEKNEVIIPKESYSAYDYSIQNVGVKIIRPNTPQDFQEALSSRTALIKLSSGSLLPESELGLEAVVKMAKPWNIPILADGAAEILTIPNVHLKRGATMVSYSGGKVLCGPQCAGLLLGRKDILLSAWQASSPHHGAGRDNKVGREEMIGMLATVEAWVKRDHAAEWKKWVSWMENIAKRVSGIEGVKTTLTEPTGLGNRSPSLSISWNPAKLNITGDEVSDILISTKPRITLGAGRSAAGTTSVSITAFQMQEGEDKIVADRLYEVLSEKRGPKVAPAMKAPAANLNGQWDVNIEFSSGQSQHSWFIEQDGNWLQGSHKGDFSVRDVSGSIDGNEFKLFSPAPRPHPNFIFWGTVSGDTITGKINMGDYLDAKFMAKRHIYPAGTKTPITIPVGHIMSS
jgi:D-glucosaminate-6-phosphate ammonia-lyase